MTETIEYKRLIFKYYFKYLKPRQVFAKKKKYSIPIKLVAFWIVIKWIHARTFSINLPEREANALHIVMNYRLTVKHWSS